MPLLLLALGCQSPLGDRHHLDDYRIAAVTAEARPDGTVDASAVVVVDGELFHEDLSFAWWWSEASRDAALVDQVPLSVFPHPVLEAPDGPRRLVLTVESLDFGERRAFIDVPEAGSVPPVIDHLDVGRVVGHRLEDLVDEDLPIEVRAEWETDEAALLPEDIARIAVAWGGAPAATNRVRWMSTAPFGSFLELDRQSADWVAGELVVDDGEIQSKAAFGDAVVSIVALALDDRGGTDVKIRDVVVGEPPDQAVRIDERLLMVQPVVSGPFRGQVNRDADAPLGFHVSAAVAFDPQASLDEDPWGTSSLPCLQAVSGPFDPEWMSTGVCRPSDLDGRIIGFDP